MQYKKRKETYRKIMVLIVIADIKAKPVQNAIVAIRLVILVKYVVLTDEMSRTRM